MTTVEKLIEDSTHWPNSDNPSSAKYLYGHQTKCKIHLGLGAISSEEYMTIINSVASHASKSGNLTKLMEVLSS
jgi:hypothetical protein